MTTYTTGLKQELRFDISYIDEQLDSVRREMAAGNKGEARSLLEGLLDYYDFKKHFPDIWINDDESMPFVDMYEALRSIDDLIEIDATEMLINQGPAEWRPTCTRQQVLQRLRDFLAQIEAWLALRWLEGEEVVRSLEVLRQEVEAFIRFFQNFVKGQFNWGPIIDVVNAKKGLLRAVSGRLPFAEIYELLMTMDRDLLYLVFRFRLHLGELTPEGVATTLEEVAKAKHSIQAIIDATRAEDEFGREPAPEEDDEPLKRPPGWDDLQPFPPVGYGFRGGTIVPIWTSRRTGGARRVS